MEHFRTFIEFLNKLEKKIFGFIVFLIFANICIFLYEWNEGRMVSNDPNDEVFIVQSLRSTEDKSIIKVLEAKPSSTPISYNLEVNLTAKDLKKLNVKPNRKLLINTVISENNAGKKVRQFKKIKFNKKAIYDLSNE